MYLASAFIVAWHVLWAHPWEARHTPGYYEVSIYEVRSCGHYPVTLTISLLEWYKERYVCILSAVMRQVSPEERNMGIEACLFSMTSAS